MSQFFKKLIAFFSPPHLLDDELNRIAHILYLFILILIPAFIITMIIQGYDEDFKTIKILAAGSFFLLLSYILLKTHSVKTAIFLTGLTLLSVVTMICTYGQGIHSIAISAYPGILIISSLLLKKRYFVILIFFTLLSLFWLIYGEQAGLFITKKHGIGDWGDLINTSMIILISAITAYAIAFNLRQSLKQKGNEIIERKKAERALHLSLDEKNILLKELHHRVKNNLTFINSLMNLQERYINNKAQAIKAFKNLHYRIYSMALVYETMYHVETVNKIIFGPYTEEIVKQIESKSQKNNIDIKISIKDVYIGLEKAISCGILITEALSNALEYAFPENQTGEINIKMTQGHDHLCELKISDNGIGFPEHISTKDHSQSFGLKLIHLMAKQLNADLKIESKKNKGTKIWVKFAGNT